MSCVQLFVTPWTVALQVPLSMGFPSKNTRMGCYFLLQGIFPTQGSNPCLLRLVYWQADSYCRATGEAPTSHLMTQQFYSHLYTLGKHLYTRSKKSIKTFLTIHSKYERGGKEPKSPIKRGMDKLSYISLMACNTAVKMSKLQLYFSRFDQPLLDL